MSSQRRIDSSRANGARSRGPKTPEGLARCRAASITHGLCARRIVLPNESEDDFRALREVYIGEFQPESSVDRNLVDLLAAARWRRLRLFSTETTLLNDEMARQEPEIREEYDAISRAALAFRALCDESRVLANLDRYDAHLNRICEAAREALVARRRNRGKTKKYNRVPVPQTDSAA